MRAKYEIHRARDGQFHFHLKAANGEIILSSELYRTRAGAKNGIASVQRCGPLIVLAQRAEAMRFDVLLTEEATENARVIRDWLADRSIDGAFNWLDAFDDARRRLSELAGSFGRAPEDDWFEEELRHVLNSTRESISNR